MIKRLLIVFVKNPELGKVKTRLAKSIGDEAALAAYLRLLDHTRQVAKAVGFDVAVYYSSFVDSEDAWDNEKFQKYVQEGADIGVRMHNAIKHGLKNGNYDAACLVGGDIYDLSPEIIDAAFQELIAHDVVLGPAEDGGYYLIGMKEANENIFRLEKWSEPKVFGNTVDLIKSQKLTYSTVKTLNDIDTIEDTKGTDLLSGLSLV